jgi:hypothetical protein
MPFRPEDWELGPAVTVKGLPRFVFGESGNEGFSTPHFHEKNASSRYHLATSVFTVFWVEPTTESAHEEAL